MNKIKVIHPKNLPQGIPLFKFATVYLLLEHFQAAAFVQGICFCLMAILCIAGAARTIKEKYVNILEKEAGDE